MKIYENEIVGLIGESGCGKSTIASMILKLESIDNGKILYNQKSIKDIKKNKIKDYRKNVQVVFQNVLASLNPKMKIFDIIAEPLSNFYKLTKEEIRKEVEIIIEKVGLEKSDLEKFPKEFSGGQRQRIAIARAIVIKPKLLVFDEPTSSLDVSIQAQIIDLLLDLKNECKMSYLFISHDLALVRYFCDRVYVMYLGKNIEILNSDDLISKAKHPYTKLLLSSIPVIGKKNILNLSENEFIDLNDKNQKCKFYSRCKERVESCRDKNINLIKLNENHFVACSLFNK